MSFGRRQCSVSLDAVFASTVYLSLHTGNPGEDGQTSNEVSGGSYAAVSRATGTWNAATSADPSVKDNSSDITWPTATADWGTITHVGVWNHATNRAESNYIGMAALAVPQPVLNGNTFSIATGNLDFTLD